MTSADISARSAAQSAETSIRAAQRAERTLANALANVSSVVQSTVGLPLVTSHAALGAFPAPVGVSAVQLQYFTSFNDKGGGIFDWLPGSNVTPVPGMIVGTYNASTYPGQWYRRCGDELHSAWFGVRANESTDDTAAMQAAINFAAHKTLVLDKGVNGGIIIKSKITIASEMVIRGCARGAVAFIWSGTSSDVMIHVTDACANITLQDFSLDNTGAPGVRASVGLRVDAVRGVIERVQASGPQAIFDTACIQTNPDATVYNVVFRDCYVSSRNPSVKQVCGFKLGRGHTISLDHCMASCCAKGAELGGGGGQSILCCNISGGSEFESQSVYGSSDIGIDCVFVEGLNISGACFEMAGDSLVGGENQRAIKLQKVRGGIIAGCYFLGTGVATADITVASSDTVGVKIEGNYFDDTDGYAIEATGDGSLWAQEIGRNHYNTGNVLGVWDNSFTPSLSFGGGSTSMTYARAVGRGDRHGKFLTVTIDIELSAKGSSTGSAKIGGLPSLAVSAQTQPIALFTSALTSIVGAVTGFVDPSSHQIQLFQSGTGSVTALAETNFVDNSVITVQATYEVA